MLLNPNNDYFYNCNRLPNLSDPIKDIDRGTIIARTFPYYQMINQNILQVINMSTQSLLTIKILPWISPASHEEYRKYCQLSLISDKTFIFPTILGWFDFVGLPFHWKMQYLARTKNLFEEDAIIEASKPDRNDERSLFIVYDSISAPFKEEKDIKTLFILLHGLYLGRKFFNLHHGNFELMIRVIDSTEMDFNVEDQRFVLENVERIPVIVDLGNAKTNIQMTSDLKDLEKIFPTHGKLFASSAWQTSARSYSNDYQAIKRILHSDYFSIFKPDDNLVKPPIGAGTFNRVYKTVGNQSVIRFGIVKPDNLFERMEMFNHSQRVLERLVSEKKKFGPSLFRQIQPGRWIESSDPLANDITVIDLQEKGQNDIYAHEIEYLEGDSLSTDLFPNLEGCFSLVWFLYSGYYSNLRHRDIKGENCVIRTYPAKKTFTFESKNYKFKITTDRVPVFIDFDVCSFEPDSFFRNVIGSLYTCPPGLLIAKFVGEDQYDDKTYDWWSLGITLFCWYTWNALTDFQQYANIVNTYFGENARPTQNQVQIIATLIFYCHINFIISPTNEVTIYGFLDPISEEIIANIKQSENVRAAYDRYRVNTPEGAKQLIRKFLSNDIEERASDMEETIRECFADLEDMEGGVEKSDYVFVSEEKIGFSPKKSPLPAFEEMNNSFDMFSPQKKLQLQEEEEVTSPYIYKRGDFIETKF